MPLTLPRARRLSRGTSREPGVLALPQGCTVRRLSDPDSRDAVTVWLRQSPDHTLYHLWPYIESLCLQNAIADVFLVSRDGNALFALTVHSWTGMGVESGYSGVVFPATQREGTLRRSVSALAELIAVNRHLLFRIQQSAQAPAYDDEGRVTLLQRLIEGEGLLLDPVYGRLSSLEYLPDASDIPTTPGRHSHALAIDPAWLTGDSLRAYDPDARNQIRQAVRRGLTVEYVRSTDPAARASAYSRFQPLHEESWRRTGLVPKLPGYFLELSESMAAGGGEDLVVLALDPNGNPVAGVLCHAYQERAIYWSGCSSESGQRSRANPLCLHGAIVACRNVGVRTFELGRCRADETSKKERAITDYKAQFGGRLVRLSAFTSTPGVAVRMRTARATAVFEARRQVAMAVGRARAWRDARDHDDRGSTSSLVAIERPVGPARDVPAAAASPTTRDTRVLRRS
jgi:Acetyltransferase (GNAT) domain